MLIYFQSILASLLGSSAEFLATIVIITLIVIK